MIAYFRNILIGKRTSLKSTTLYIQLQLLLMKLVQKLEQFIRLKKRFEAVNIEPNKHDCDGFDILSSKT